MSRAPSKRRAHGASTIVMDMSIRYPYDLTCMSISPYGRDVVLGGQAGLAIIDLEIPLLPPRTVRIDSRWKMATVAWCPSTVHHGWVGSTMSQTLLIHDLAHATEQPMRVVKAHPMAITDMAWVPMVPSWIGTASIDPLVKIWDVRRDQKPVWFYTDWEPADKLAFNNVNKFMMATAHRNKIAVWDLRHGSSPLAVIEEAHGDDISSISWHPTLENVLVSGSLDCMVKRWSIENDILAEEYCHSFSHEVLGAKYLPFGSGVLVTQRSPDNTTIIIKDSPQMSVAHQFIGHTGPVLGSEWRSYGVTEESNTNKGEFQLVTWSQDQALRMWAVDHKLFDMVGSEPVHHAHVRTKHYDVIPSFSTNYLDPDQVLHLMEKKLLPSDLLLAAATASNSGVGGGGGSGSLGAHKISTMHELDRAGSMLEGIGLISMLDSQMMGGNAVSGIVPDAGKRPGVVGAVIARTNTTDEHSSDDDDDEDIGNNAGARGSSGARGRTAIAAADIWLDEIDTTVLGTYRSSKTVVAKDINRDARRCRLVIGVPWLSRENVVLRFTFPIDYPSQAVGIAIESSGSVYGSREILANRVTGVAGACASQGVVALEQCLYSFITLLISIARGKGSSHDRLARAVRAEDLERLPPAPAPLARGKAFGSGGRQRNRSGGAHQASSLSPSARKAARSGEADGGARSRSRSAKRGSGGGGIEARVVPTSLTSDDNASVLSRDGEEHDDYSDDEDNGDDQLEDYQDKAGADSGDEDEDEEEDDDDEFGVYGLEDDRYNFYQSDNSQSEVAIGLDGLSISLRQANNRDRYDSHTPFPRLCGGVFSGPGHLVCFFASIYSPETYPEQSGLGQQGPGSRRAYRDDMSHQLRVLVKPRTLTSLDYYQSMVQLGLQSGGGFFPYGGDGGNGGGGTAAAGGVGGDSDDDGEARDEEVPRYYFRQPIARMAAASASNSDVSERRAFLRPAMAASRAEAEVGNLALVCRVALDRSADLALARRFVLAGPSTEGICRHNARVAAASGRAGLARTWALLACLLGPVPGAGAGAGDGGHRLWAKHPAVMRWLRAVMTHYERRGDVQALALLSCVLSKALAEAAATRGEAAAAREDAAAARDESAAVETLLSAWAAKHAVRESVQRSVSFKLPPVSLKPPPVSFKLPPPPPPPPPPVALAPNPAATEGEAPGSTDAADAEPPPPRALDALRSPEILLELDSEEIKQNEIMMAEGIGAAGGEDDGAAGDEEGGAAFAGAGDDGTGELRRHLSEQLPEEERDAAEADGAENIWRRLRTNMLGRSHTVGGSSAPAPAAPASQAAQAAPAASAAPPVPAAPSPADRWRTAAAATADGESSEAAYARVKGRFARRRTQMTLRTTRDARDDGAAGAYGGSERAQALYLDHWKLLYARILYKWAMDAKAVEVLKCIQDPALRELYNGLKSQPTEPQHDNLPRVGIPALAADPEPRGAAEPQGAPWLSCAWCHEYVHGRALICHACGHGGHQEHMLRWFRIAHKQLARIGMAPTALPAAAAASASLVPDDGDRPALLLDMQPTPLPPLPPAAAPSRRPSEPPMPTSSDSSADSDAADETTPGSSVHRFALGAHFEHMRATQQPEWDSSDVESDDHLQPPPLAGDTAAAGAPWQDPRHQRRQLELLDDAFMAQVEIPTCPTGCGCNCLYESRRLII
ncbi:hypothetical protein H4R26_003387 [Coemansia thaxteri]|uniref:Uncharacterized protein n=1 Tax=Coemansia thaxteri TaxID=2663907 RepID=A0A9W8EF22_9FUNG|nr:hypothetical protein H4R26_003387 [Coemansia thaxteri]